MTNLYDLVSAPDLARAFDEGLVSVRHSEDNQAIWNYTDKAMYTPGAWDNAAVSQCRGLIVGWDDHVVARPWAKFFNYGQKEAGELDLDAPVEVTDKMDGSLGIIHVDENGKTRVATRGSFESEQAIHATKWIQEQTLWTLDDAFGWTPLVEIIYPENRIVCDYGRRDELVLLGAVHIESGEYIGPEEARKAVGWPFFVTKTFEYGTLREALAAEPRPGAEGLCVRFIGENRIVKIKQEDYLRLHKIVSGLSERSVWEAMVAGQTLDQFLIDLPDEFHEWVGMVWGNLAVTAASKHLQAQYHYVDVIDSLAAWGIARHNPDFRKSFAAKANTRTTRPYLFMQLDGKDPYPAILKSLKPKGETHARVFSQEAA